MYKFLLVFIFPFCLFAQNIFTGTIRDVDTNLPLTYVNIGFVDKEIGTVSNKKGAFYLEYDTSKLSISDTLKVSYLGYKDYYLLFSELQKNGNKPVYIKLESEAISLSEVIITNNKKNNKPKKKKIVGYSVVSKNKKGSWEGSGALGGEMVTKIMVIKKKRQLNALYFHVLENFSDSLLIRVNVYQGDTRYPEKKLSTKNIFYTIKSNSGKVGIDLEPYNIIVYDDFYIGIELLKNYGSKVRLLIAADDSNSVSYQRYTSQGAWRTYSKDALAYSVSTTLLDEKTDGKEEVTFLADYSEQQLLSPAEKNRNDIYGFVFNNGEPTEDVQIKNLTTGKVTFTDATGRYKLTAKVNDELEFSYLGMRPEMRKIFEPTVSLNVSLQRNLVELDNVDVVESTIKRRPRNQEELSKAYLNDKEIIKTTIGFKDSRHLNLSSPIISGEGLSKGVFDVVSLLQAHVPSLSIIRNNQNTGNPGQDRAVRLRRGTKNVRSAKSGFAVIYDIDGVIYEKLPLFLSVNEVDRVAVLNREQAAAMYGNKGVNGVIVINTIEGNLSLSSNTQKNKTLKLLEKQAITEKEARQNWPNFLQQLYESNDLNKAKTVYDTYDHIYGSNSNFNVDVSTYFMQYWPQEEFTKNLIAENLERSKKDLNYIKAMAFLMDKYKKTNESIELYKRIMVQRSNFAQSYRDLANAYVISDLKKKGTNIYARYFNLVEEGYFSEHPEGIEQVIRTEVKALLNINDEVSHAFLDLTRIDNDNSRTRILLEWNDDSADISFQFVSPYQSMPVWSNNLSGGNEGSFTPRVFTSKDFIVYGDSEIWEVFANYKGNKSGLAIYLKVTRSTNYGTNSQQDNIELYRLDTKNVNRKLAQVKN